MILFKKVCCAGKKTGLICKKSVKRNLIFYIQEMTSMTRILIIDDDMKLQKLLEDYLKSYGYEVFHHEEGLGACEAIDRVNPEIILLDVMLPGMDGIEVLREIRTSRNIPVIMLTAKGDEADRIVGLELGADDYLPKPFNPRELLARIKAVLRRFSSDDVPRNQKETDARIIAGGVVLDPNSMMIECNGKSVELSKTEYRIMEALMRNPNIVLSRDAIMNIARGRDVMSFERSIDVHVSRLRMKVEEVCGDKNRIKTVWGTGYKFVV
jgi:two-component system, OmpR family, phosphate regulon response regulator OmpR